MYMLMYTRSMAQRYSIADARVNLPEIVDRAEAGLTVELTRRGRPVALVVSPRALERLTGDRPRFGDAYKTFLATHAAEEVGLDADFAAGVRDKSPGRKASV
jgi:prevent-host-death family protein